MQFTIILKNKNKSKNDSKLVYLLSLNKKWHQLSSIGAIWLCDPDGTNFNIFLDDLKKLAYYMKLSVFQWLYEFGLDVRWGLKENAASKNKSLTSFIKTALACVTKLKAVLHLRGVLRDVNSSPNLLWQKSSSYVIYTIDLIQVL
ncbi:hypothetical protein EYY60_16300 [Flavobacterium zhairuonense]|uniref:hypothetical protein n=1 Tax=Flavobacterium zhairuonense TaxID=2493631 RepID=UPI001047646E|nr:hypothetical protein [Flavobacterium zhairuonense]KAF2508682.1 hypothetical protein EYY60_16300 [Flavobacterium zhairuonense]